MNIQLPTSPASGGIPLRDNFQLRTPEPQNSKPKTYNLLMLAALLVLAPGNVSAQYERILSYDSQISVNSDASLTVSETIDVNANGDQIKHGIYRDFPTRYADRYGGVVVAGFKVIQILRDGKSEPYRIANRQNGKRVYIGNPNVLLDPGGYEYTIIYKTTRQLGFFGKRDELYWNVTGNGWVFPIDKVSAEVVLPPDVPRDKIEVRTFTGLQGSTYTMAEHSADETAPVLRFRTTEVLGPNEGLTIAVRWPSGFVQRPSRYDKIIYFLSDNRSSIIGILGLALLLVYYTVTWSKVGDDPERGTIVPQWEIPDGLSPAAIRFVSRMGYDNKAFASALLDMAVKRYITIIKDGKTYTIRKDEAAQGVLATEEQMVADSLFKLGDSIELVDDNHVTIGTALKLLGYDLNNRFAPKYFARNTGYAILGIAFSLVILLLSSLNQISPASGVVMMLIIPFALVNCLFYRLLRCITIPGRRLLDKIEGLRMYLTIAEQDRLNALNPPERTPQLFEQFLPYALALNVEHQWAEQFTNILAKAGEGGAPYSPTWYMGDSWHDLGSGRFASAVGDSLAGAITSSSTAPGSSSGSGGGGSSGGGGGGGGGGGW